MILNMFLTLVLVITIAYSFCLVFQNSYAQIEIPRTYVNMSQLQRIDQTIATYAIIITPGASSQNNPYHYYPEFSAIPANTTVLWYNNNTDQVHTVVSGLPADPNSGQTFASDIIPYDSYFKYTFNEAGKYSYHCEIHPWRVGFISVNDKVVRNGDFEISSGTSNILNLTDQDRVLVKFKPVSFIHDPTKSIPYTVTIFRDKTNEVFSDVFHVEGNELQLDLVPSDIPTRVVGPDFIKPTTGAYHIEGRFLTQNGDYTMKIQIGSMDNKPLERPIQGEYTIRIVTNQ
jgi:plastocyanin